MDTAGVFCAVTSDQYDDLYIDKDDLMPELVSDDDTDSEDGSPLHEGMTGLSITELSILPSILQAFDPKQLSYEAVSAELARPLPRLARAHRCVLYTHTAVERHR